MAGISQPSFSHKFANKTKDLAEIPALGQTDHLVFIEVGGHGGG